VETQASKLLSCQPITNLTPLHSSSRAQVAISSDDGRETVYSLLKKIVAIRCNLCVFQMTNFRRKLVLREKCTFYFRNSVFVCVRLFVFFSTTRVCVFKYLPTCLLFHLWARETLQHQETFFGCVTDRQNPSFWQKSLHLSVRYYVWKLSSSVLVRHYAERVLFFMKNHRRTSWRWEEKLTICIQNMFFRAENCFPQKWTSDSQSMYESITGQVNERNVRIFESTDVVQCKKVCLSVCL
jgi:hypothetical protein